MKKIIMPDYTNCLVNLMASIKRHFYLPYSHSTLKDVDRILDNGQYRSVVILLLDGMGSKILDKHLKKTCYLQKNKLRDFLSVFPSTTAAATTVVQSACAPCETGWLGWHQYFSQLQDDIVMFMGTGYYNQKVYDKNIVHNYVPYTKFGETLINAGYVFCETGPEWYPSNPCSNFEQLLSKIDTFVNSNDKRQYMYAYWSEPDHFLHDQGTKGEEVHSFLQMANCEIENLSHKLPDDAIVFVIADHGHHDVKEIDLYKHPDILELLDKLPSIEPRNASFFIKKGKKRKFVKLFNKKFGNDFILFTKKEVIEKKLFGPFNNHQLFESFLGDYQAIAVGDYMFGYKDPKVADEYLPMKATHAGILEDEMLIPLIKITKAK